jgi:hypothetical protein
MIVGVRPGVMLSLPERAVRALVAVVGGVAHETAQLVLPRLVRRSRLYEATAKNLLRVAIELVGGVEGALEVEPDAPAAGRLAVRKGAGNAVELGSIAAFGFSPLWLLAGASDVAHGSRVYLHALTEELKRAGVLGAEVEVDSVDELLGALEHGTGETARLIDVPPLELAELRRTLAELRADARALPAPRELAALYAALRATARAERASLLEVSSGVGLAFLLSARSVTSDHVVLPYREDWRPLRHEGFAAYARRIVRPYGRAVSGHLDLGRPTWTEKLVGRLSRDV